MTGPMRSGHSPTQPAARCSAASATTRQIANLDALLVEVVHSIKPPVRIRTDHRELAGGKPVLVVEVLQGDTVHEAPGGAYIRVGASKRLMTSDERMRLTQRRGQARFRWFDEQTVPGTGLQTLDADLWKPFLSSAGAADPEAALEKMGFLAHDEHGVKRATVAGTLLCSRAPQEWLPNACITATCYRGKDRTTGQIDAQTITGPLNRQIAEADRRHCRALRAGGVPAGRRDSGSDLIVDTHFGESLRLSTISFLDGSCGQIREPVEACGSGRTILLGRRLRISSCDSASEKARSRRPSSITASGVR